MNKKQIIEKMESEKLSDLSNQEINQIVQQLPAFDLSNKILLVKSIRETVELTLSEAYDVATYMIENSSIKVSYGNSRNWIN